MKTEPLGFYVLIEMDGVSNTIQGGALAGFKLSSDAEHKREQGASETGTVLAFGPTAYLGFSGCEGPEDWGVKVGDRVEYERYDGKPSLFDKDGQPAKLEDRRLRYIPDSKIIGVIK